MPALTLAAVIGGGGVECAAATASGALGCDVAICGTSAASSFVVCEAANVRLSNKRNIVFRREVYVDT